MAAELDYCIRAVIERCHIEIEQRGQADYLANQQQKNKSPTQIKQRRAYWQAWGWHVLLKPELDH
jgi:hypothetical protein